MRTRYAKPKRFVMKRLSMVIKRPFQGMSGEMRMEDRGSRMEDRGWRKAMIYTSSSIVDLILYSRSSILYPRCSILDLLGPARRDTTGQKGHNNQQKRYAGKSRRVGSAHSKQQRRNRASESQRTG